jgi:4-hydroxy-2-oxoheptanedioate aldolase
VDACFIGPNDMAASMGIGLGVPLESDHPKLVEAIEHVRVTCEKHGVAPGIHCSHAEGVQMRMAQGFKFLAMASEMRYLMAGLRADLGKLDWQPAASAAPAGATVRY